jgi:hypothetical protein
MAREFFGKKHLKISKSNMNFFAQIKKINANPPSNLLKRIGIICAIICTILKAAPDKKSLVMQNSLKASIRLYPSTLIVSSDSLYIDATVYNAGIRPAENIKLSLYLDVDSATYIDTVSYILQLPQGGGTVWPKAVSRNYSFLLENYYLTDNEISGMYIGLKAIYEDAITKSIDSSMQIAKVYNRRDSVITLGIVTDKEYKRFVNKNPDFSVLP